MVDFHGWEMPVRYGSIPDEHLKVRHCAGLFDLCHMGRLEVTGKDAAQWIGKVITNDFDALKPGDARYTLIVNEGGTIIDDAIVYRLPETALLVVNASNRAAVVDWMESHRGDLEARLVDRSRDLAMIAIQGPQALRILHRTIEIIGGRTEAELAGMPYYSITGGTLHGKPAWFARTGYTGEDGFEVYIDSGDAPRFWREVLETGVGRVAPIGLGARDTLRLEAGMPLYGHELDLTTDPFEARLGFAVKLEKAVPFIGQKELEARKKRGPARRLTGFKVDGKRVARQGMKIHREADGAEVGIITSGAPSPTLGHPIAMGYLATGYAESDSAGGKTPPGKAAASDVPILNVDIRGNMERLLVEPLPFFSRTRKKPK